jgi:hypothetical protein
MHFRRLLAAALSSLLLFNAPAAADDDVVTRWNSAALAAIRVERTSPPVASRALAILHTSIFDAINGIARTYEHYWVPSYTVPATASVDAAASAAAHRVLLALFPAEAPIFDPLYAALLEPIPDSPQKTQGIEWGEAVATKILFWRRVDRSGTPVAPPANSGPGA